MSRHDISGYREQLNDSFNCKEALQFYGVLMLVLFLLLVVL